MVDLLERQGGLRVEAAPIDVALKVLGQRFTVSRLDSALMIKAGRDDAPGIIASLVEANVQVFHVSAERRSLEDAFLSITQAPKS